MATSYTPGLKVLKKTLFKTKRILPLKGDVHVEVGQNIKPDTIVASTNLPGNIQMVKLSNILNIEPRDVLLAKIAGGFNAPLVKVAAGTKAIISKAGYALSALVDKKVSNGEVSEVNESNNDDVTSDEVSNEEE